MLTVSFFGHRQLPDPLLTEQLEKRLMQHISSWLNEQTYVEFLVGCNGEFDRLTASVIRRCQKTIRHDNSTLVLMLPYATAEYRNNEASFRAFYDEIDIITTPNGRYAKSAFRIRNNTMIDRSDFVIFYVDRPYGGAYQTLCYAVKTGTAHINLGEPNPVVLPASAKNQLSP